MTTDPAEAVISYYSNGAEMHRLGLDHGPLEQARTEELLGRCLPPPPATILDVGSGPGAYAIWLATLGYRVHVRDIVEEHVQEATPESAARSAPWA